MDTSAFKAFYDEQDDHHIKARGLMEDIASKKIVVRGFITSDYILDETVTVIRFAHSHFRALEFPRAVTVSRRRDLSTSERKTL